MVLEAPYSARDSARGRRVSSRPALSEALKQLPTRRPAPPSGETSELTWQLVDVDRYEVRRGNEVRGYIDVVGAVFVTLAGRRYPRAHEILQTLIFDDAIAALA